LRQGFTKFGDHILRKQSFNIGYFDKDKAYHVIEKVQLEAQEVTDVPQFVGKEVPLAILMNSEDYGFAVFAVDKRCSRFYEENLAKVPN